MRKLIGVLLGLTLLAVATVLVGPNFIDWNNYKDEVTRRVKEMTGRDLAINGNIRVAFLPAPALVASDVSLANLDGATARDMVTLKSAEIRVALAPLLGGQVKVETLKLIEPVIHLEILSDGSANWEFEAVKGGTGGDANPTASVATRAGQNSAPPIAFDNLTIENATLIYRNSVSSVTERIEKLSAQITAASLQGPMETIGSATVRGVPLNFNLNVGEIIHDRTVPFKLRAGAVAGNVTGRVGGMLVNLTEVPKFKGNVKVEGEDLAATLASISVVGVPSSLAQSFYVGGDVTATAAEVQMVNVDIGLGTTRASGDLRFDMGDKPSVNARLEVRKVDLDALVATKSASTSTGSGTIKDMASPKIVTPMAKGPFRFNLPKGLEASAIVSIDAIVFRNDVIRDALLNAKLADGLLTVNQISAQFPGGSDLVASMSLHTPNGVPAFSANVDSTVNDLRGVLRWLDFELPSVPADRLRKMSLRAQLIGTPEQVQMNSLDLQFDSSRLTGGITVALRERLGVGASLTLDRLNLDSYMSATKTQVTLAPAGTAGKSGGAITARNSGGNANPFHVLAALTRIDANVKAHVKSLVYEANPIRDLVIDATVYNGAADIRRLSVGKYGGASATLKGKLKGLIVAPNVEDLRFEVKITDSGRFARIVGVELSPTLKDLGAVTAKGRINGNLLHPQVDVTAGLAGGTIGMKGRVSVVPRVDIVDARFSLKHKDLVGLMSKFGSSYRPAGRIGSIKLDADVKASAKAVSMKNLRAAIGKLSVRGEADIALGGPKPVINGAIEADELVIDPFLPAISKRARRASNRAPKDTTRRSSSRSAPVGRQFPNDLIDLSNLNSVDADLQFRVPTLAYDKFMIENLDFSARLKNGVLTVPALSGQIFDGSLNATLEAATGPRNRLAIRGGVNGVNMAKSLKAMTGEVLANGRMKIDLDFASTGQSIRDLVGRLGGTASVALTDVDVEKAGKGTTISGLLGLLTSLNKLSGSNTNDRAEITGTFRVEDGIAHSKDIKIASAYGDGAAAGDINLPAWTINMIGQMQLGQSFITQLLRAKIREMNSAMPFAITGALDAPNVKVDTGALFGPGILIPNADTLSKKAPKGVGNILRDILGGGALTTRPKRKPLNSPPPITSGGQNAPVDMPPLKPLKQRKAPAVNPEELLKQLFKL